jgi:hypothetical protein
MDLKSNEVLSLDEFLSEYFYPTYSRLVLIKVEREAVIERQS